MMPAIDGFDISGKLVQVCWDIVESQPWSTPVSLTFGHIRAWPIDDVVRCQPLQVCLIWEASKVTEVRKERVGTTLAFDGIVGSEAPQIYVSAVLTVVKFKNACTAVTPSPGFNIKPSHRSIRIQIATISSKFAAIRIDACPYSCDISEEQVCAQANVIGSGGCSSCRKSEEIPSRVLCPHFPREEALR